ncbi:MAG: sigma-54-dependent Fis family transcriptional regulator [Lewinellaceae bacterium]|nr:sigma-54-dependent Fis family transcriptional regulator [Phaeodactylibacter sp.]MCB9036675.1 sigma-54-dependent Fis family transcriptional regulator [Lewinellaceae bacterium]
MKKQSAKILIVDDEEDILLSLQFFLSQHFEEVKVESNPYQLPRLLRTDQFDLIILDMNFKKGDTSGKDGMMWLSKVLELDPAANVIMITAYADVKTAVEAVKAGAIDFIEKPWRNEKLLTTILSALKLSRSRRQVKKLEQTQQALSDNIDQQFGEIIGNSPAMKHVFTLISKVAKTDANMLILGENGTGKELVARAIHRQSPRAREVFITVDLGAIPDSLFESELFGHKKGAFTDAREDRSGRFELASGGTLFLDEIGNLSLPLQAKLLSALQSRHIRRIGSNDPIPIDIRLICATNMPLYDMVKENTFRQDLLYRINTVEIKLPPLRERREDIPILTGHFLNIYMRKYQKPGLSISKETMKELQAYSWPGNIRELRHAVERAVILTEGPLLDIGDFILHPSDAQGQDGASQPQEELDNYNLGDIERWAIRKALTKHAGNISRAADELGLTRAALYRRMAKYDL